MNDMLNDGNINEYNNGSDNNIDNRKVDFINYNDTLPVSDIL